MKLSSYLSLLVTITYHRLKYKNYIYTCRNSFAKQYQYPYVIQLIYRCGNSFREFSSSSSSADGTIVSSAAEFYELLKKKKTISTSWILVDTRRSLTTCAATSSLWIADRNEWPNNVYTTIRRFHFRARVGMTSLDRKLSRGNKFIICFWPVYLVTLKCNLKP